MYIRNDLSGIQKFFQLHPGRINGWNLQPSPMKRKENESSKQTSMRTCSSRKSSRIFLNSFIKTNQPIASPIPSMGRTVYLPTWMVDFHGFHVGQIIPFVPWMVCEWYGSCFFFQGGLLIPNNQALDGFGHIAQHGPWKLQMTKEPTQVTSAVITGFHPIGITLPETKSSPLKIGHPKRMA